jgi:hypothetical protein
VPETGAIKNPDLAAGFFGSISRRSLLGEVSIARVDPKSPAGDLFSRAALRTGS